MVVKFNLTRGRMFVGYRGEDWCEVWMEPKAPQEDEDDPNADDGACNFDLYKLSTGNKGRREPMIGEVRWLPHLDPKYCVSSSQAERTKLHKQFLTDSQVYLSARDEKFVRELEQRWHKPRSPKWQSWFDLMKKYKRKQMPELRQGDVNNGDDDEDDDDSAYNSDEERYTGNGSPMGHPRRPASSNKRKAPGDGRRMPGSKRTKFGVNGSQTRLSESCFQMSGGRGAPSTQSGSVPRSIIDDHDNQSDIYDLSPPEGVSNMMNNVINGHDWDEIRSPGGPRRRGDSREDYIPPFNEWAQNRGPRDSVKGGQNSVDEQDEDRRRVEAFNGNVDFDTAERLARDQSERPAPSINGNLDDEAAYQAAIQASMSSSPRPSIEN